MIKDIFVIGAAFAVGLLMLAVVMCIVEILTTSCMKLLVSYRFKRSLNRYIRGGK